MSKIEWTEETWNPTTGCIKISPGCKNCYAKAMSVRLQAMNANGYDNGFDLSILPERLSEPLKRRKPTMYFVNSMSDLFLEDIPFSFIDEVMDVVEKTPHHTYQILTKRSSRMLKYFSGHSVPKNAWIGVSVENRKHGLPRLDHLRGVNAKVRFLSVEPLLEDLGYLNLAGIGWVIVGGESGSGARPLDEVWVSKIRDACIRREVPFFFKQWGAFGRDGVKRSKSANGRTLQGRLWNMMPGDRF